MTRREKVIELRKQGKKYREIQEELDVSQCSISKILKKAGLHIKKSNDEYLEMLNMAMDGAPSAEIANKFNLAPVTVRGILSRHKVRIGDAKAKIREEIIRLSEKYSSTETADILGVRVSYVRNVRWKHGIKLNESYYRKIRAIEMMENGSSIDEIAEKLNLHYETVVRYYK
ncbi:hypothetical protein [Proteus phage vB_PmiM_ZX7]|nr:hypothetical protein [Proteus phage vB_PmiM_ZX7]